MQRALLLLLFVGVAAHGQVLNLHTSTALYGWQRFDSLTVSSNHYRGYESITLDVAQQQWHLRSSASLSNDFGTTQTADPLLRLYNLYIDATGIADHLDIKAGRVPVFMGSGATTIDGASLKLRLAEDRYSLALAGGGQLPAVSDVRLFSHVSENLFLGAQAIGRIDDATRIGISYVRKDRTPAPDTIMIADTGSVLHPFFFQSSAEREERIGLDASTSLYSDALDLYGRGDYDLVSKSLSRAELAAGYRFSPNFSARGEFLKRQALVAYNSFFAAFDHGDYTEGSVTATYTATPRLSVSATIAHESYTDAAALRATIAGRWDGLSLVLLSQSGDQGKQTAVSLEENYPVSSKVTLSGALAFTSYSFAASDTSRTSIALIAGGSVRPSVHLSVDAQFQYLVNVLYQSDARIFVRANWWIFERF